VVPEELDELIRRCRRGPLHRGGPSARAVRYAGTDLHAMLPHRAPFLLLDEVTSVDLEARTIAGGRTIRPDDPVLAGHFPGEPIYPGVLLVEAMSQLGGCLAHLVEGPDAAPASIWMARILHALFLEAVRPWDRLTLYSTLIDDDLATWCANQVYRGETLCTLAVLEGYHVE
jgi:3-hydroxymyristoyl/3-hydroxydecanoyl-(acyl carrier protein) dehydratase